MEKFDSHLSDESDQYASNTATHIYIIIHFLLKKMVSLLLTTIWDHTGG